MPSCHPADKLQPRACNLCRLYVDRPDLRDALDAVPPRLERPSVRAALPCLHVGPEAGPKGWHYCEHEETPLGDIVCGCKGCGPKCPGYTAGKPPELPKGWVIVPEPPALSLSPKHRRAVVTIAAGTEGKELFAASGPHMRRYAESVSADLVVLDWPGHPAWPMSAKFAIPRVLDHYDRIIYADADVLFRPGCVNLFDLCDPDEMGVCDELPWHRTQPKYGREAAYLQFRRAMGFRDVPHLPWMANCGVMVVPRSHRALLMPPAGPMPTGHCAEQDHTNARLLDSGMKYVLMDRRSNHQNWTDHGFRSAPRDAVLHWSGAGHNRAKRVADIREWAERFPWPDRVTSDLPAFDPGDPGDMTKTLAIDRRHALWIADTLLSGRFRRVLEIGCHRGYSTAAFVHALRAGKIQELHLCDVKFTPEVRSLVSGLSGVTLHECPSVELLDRDSRFDLVFVDGDHTEKNVEAETRLLLGAGVRSVFAHDTSAAKCYGDCGGPQHLKAAFQAAGYRCLEDAVLRAGELTDRGMFFASRQPDDFAAALSGYVARCSLILRRENGVIAGHDAPGGQLVRPVPEQTVINDVVAIEDPVDGELDVRAGLAGGRKFSVVEVEREFPDLREPRGAGRPAVAAEHDAEGKAEGEASQRDDCVATHPEPHETGGRR